MNVLYPLLAIIVLIMIAAVGTGAAGLESLFGIYIPYLALAAFLVGVSWRVIRWARAPVPFRITTTCGQAKSLPWLKHNPLDCPHNGWGVVGRMLLEVLFFRSLFRNTKAELRTEPKTRLLYGSDKFLWAGALAFHWSFLIILLRHFRFFTEPTPFFVSWLQMFDGFFQVGAPVFLLTDMVILAALTYLFLRRILDARLRYISLPADYFALFLIAGIAISGLLMRYTVAKGNLLGVKELAVGLFSFSPVVPEGISIVFFVHLFLVCVLLAYFPASKLMHMGGVFLSPTRNLANNNRAKRHINPWNPVVKVHTYEEWEDDFREKMKGCGLPLERE
jgi:nitrate reductase gamma subunit